MREIEGWIWDHNALSQDMIAEILWPMGAVLVRFFFSLLGGERIVGMRAWRATCRHLVSFH